jgi:hypothetical protein
VERINMVDQNTIILMESNCIFIVIKAEEPFVETFCACEVVREAIAKQVVEETIKEKLIFEEMTLEALMMVEIETNEIIVYYI